MLTTQSRNIKCLISIYVLCVILMVTTIIYLEQNPQPTVVASDEFSVQFEYDGLFDLPNFTHLLSPKGCFGRIKVILIVTSYAGDVEMRSSFRQAYPDILLHSLGIKRVFLLALINPAKTNEIPQEAIVNEHSKFGDIVQGNFYEHYRNLTYKHVMGLKWAAENCPLAHFVIKMDHDIVVDLFSVVKMLNKLPRKEISLAGYVMSNMKPIREPKNKWYVTMDEYSQDSYPNFLSGWLYITNPHTAHLLYRASQSVSYFWIDDTYVTGLVASKLSIPLVTLNNFYTTHPEHLKCCISQANFVCDFWVGPNGGDNRLVRIFQKYAENCFKVGCKVRREGESVRENCIVMS